MDRVFIEGLEVDTVIGAYDWEREIRQCLRLDLSFAWDNRKPAANDELSLALDYATVSTRIQAFAQDAQFILVETFAERLAALMDEFQIPWPRPADQARAVPPPVAWAWRLSADAQTRDLLASGSNIELRTAPAPGSMPWRALSVHCSARRCSRARRWVSTAAHFSTWWCRARPICPWPSWISG